MSIQWHEKIISPNKHMTEAGKNGDTNVHVIEVLDRQHNSSVLIISGHDYVEIHLLPQSAFLLNIKSLKHYMCIDFDWL